MYHNQYRSNRRTFTTLIGYATKEEAEARAKLLLDQLSEEPHAWARSLKYLGVERVSQPMRLAA